MPANSSAPPMAMVAALEVDNAFLSAEVEAKKVGIGFPSNRLALPKPIKSITPGLVGPVINVVFVTSANFPLVALISVVPFASGTGRLESSAPPNTSKKKDFDFIVPEKVKIPPLPNGF